MTTQTHPLVEVDQRLLLLEELVINVQVKKEEAERQLDFYKGQETQLLLRIQILRDARSKLTEEFDKDISID